jgi:hypothetical protein
VVPRGDLRGPGLLDGVQLDGVQPDGDQGGAVRRDEDPLDGVQPDGARADGAQDDALRHDELAVRAPRLGVRGLRGSW